MTRRRAVTAPAVLGDHIYVCGGGIEDYDDTAERYSMKRNEWEPLPDMPCSRNDGTAVAWQGRLLLAGGVASPGDNDECMSFDPENRSWSFRHPLLRQQAPLQGAACALLAGALYVCGGSGSDVLVEDEQVDPWPEALRLVRRYVLATGVWETVPPMLEARYGAAAAAVGGLLYVAGGGDGARCLRSAERFDPSTNSWCWLPPMSCERGRPGAAAVREVVDRDADQPEPDNESHSSWDSDGPSMPGSESGESECCSWDLCCRGCGRPGSEYLGGECEGCYAEH